MPDLGNIPLLQLQRIGKRFSGVEVLRQVDFTLTRGEIHALVGENGAGKSTLIKILAGVYTDYTGRILIDGRPVRFADPRDAAKQGIAVIHQELALIPHLTIAENMFLAREPRNRLGWLDRRALYADAAAALRDFLGLDLDARRCVVDLPLGARQLVEIAKALTRNARILVMDEPTSALGDADIQRLYAATRQLRARGVGVIYISHKLEEIYDLADRVTVLRDGALVGTARSSDLPRRVLIEWMLGRHIEHDVRRSRPPVGPERLRVERLWLRSRTSDRWSVQDASFSVHGGEIVGLVGRLGSGASELLGAVFGRHGPPDRGTIRVDGQVLPRPSPQASLRAGVALLTNDRQASGLVAPLSVLGNMSLATLDACRRYGLYDPRQARRHCAPYVERMRLHAPSLAAEVRTLSGGNQQKVLLARWLLTRPRVLLLDEPTRGIDVGAKADIYALLHELADRGLGIVLITSELPELLALADRVLVMHRGRIVSTLPRPAATQERVLRAAMGDAS